MISRVASGIVATLVLGVGLSVARNATAAPQDLFGFGARSSSMGMTAAASAEGYEAVYGNPALLAETRTKALTLGYGFARHELHADTPSQPQTLGTDPMKTIYIGAVLPLPFGGILKDRITFGVGFLNPVRFLVRGKILYPERLQYPIVAPRVQSVAIIMGLGARIGERFYLGAGFEALAGVVGEILIQLDATGRVSSRTDDQVIAAFAPMASAALDLGDRWRVGVVYRGQLVGRFALNIRVQDLGIPLPDFNVAGIAQYIPEQLAMEVRWSSRPHTGAEATPSTIASTGWRATGGILVRRWSRYPGPNEPTVLLNPEYGTGSKFGTPNDTISPRIGVERLQPLTRHAGIRIRAGYALEPTPLPKQNSKDNLLDSTRHVLTAGFGVVVDDTAPFQVDFFAQLHLLNSRRHDKTDPEVAGAEPVTSGGNIVVVGLTAGVRF